MLAGCYERFIAGETMRSLVLDLNANGLQTTTGGLVTLTSLGRVLDTGFAACLIRERSNPPRDGTNPRRLANFDVWRQGAHPAIISAELRESYRDRRKSGG